MHLCSSCGKNFDTEAKLKKHFSQVHDMRPRTCKECGEQFNGNLKLSTHMKSHQKFICTICMEEVSKSSATSHKYKCKGIKLLCSNCPFEAVRPDQLKVHEKIHKEKVVPEKTNEIEKSLLERYPISPIQE